MKFLMPLFFLVFSLTAFSFEIPTIEIPTIYLKCVDKKDNAKLSFLSDKVNGHRHLTLERHQCKDLIFKFTNQDDSFTSQPKKLGLEIHIGTSLYSYSVEHIYDRKKKEDMIKCLDNRGNGFSVYFGKEKFKFEHKQFKNLSCDHFIFANINGNLRIFFSETGEQFHPVVKGHATYNVIHYDESSNFTLY